MAAEPIAIIGMGAIFPGRGDTQGFWRDIVEGRDLMSDVPPTHWLTEDYFDPGLSTPDRTYGRRGGFISPVAFEPMAFGIPPSALDSTDTAQLLALIAAKMTLDEAEKATGGKIDRSRTSVILGVASATELTAHMAGRLQRPVWVNALRQAGIPEDEVQEIAARIEAHYAPWKESTFPGLLGNVVAGRIANRLDLGGSNYVTDAACASSLSALQIALHELRAGDADMVLTGGVDALNDILMFMCFSKTPALSPTGDCRPFSSAADGTMLGEGIGMVALRRLSDALRDGNTIHAVIRGLGGASDGRGTAVYTPLPMGQARALERAYEQAGYGPETVTLVEAHGTGTRAGDKAELEGLHLVFGEAASRHDRPWCAIGSVKSQIGHTKAAAGAASLIKVVEALRRKILPPTIKIEEPAESLRESPCFYANTEARPWIAPEGQPRRASVSSFGFGGSNFHVTLEEHVGANSPPPRAFPAELFLFSAAGPAALAEAIGSYAGNPPSDDAFPARASASMEAFSADAAARAAIVASDPTDFVTKASRIIEVLAQGGYGMRPLPQGCSLSVERPAPGKVAFVFSGQGSQYVGMGADLAMAFPAARRVWDMAAGHPVTGALQLHRLAFPPAAFDQVEVGRNIQRLTAMEHAQPAIAAVTLAQLALLEAAGIDADMAAGHSFGEVMALHHAGAFDAATALALAATRGREMARAAAASEGAMLAVQTSADRISPILAAIGGGLVLANDNSPNQVVVSGAIEEVIRAEAAITAQGLKAFRLPVASAFHSNIVAAAVDPFAEFLTTVRFRKLRFPVYANVTAAPYPSRLTDLPVLLSRQIASPVRFRETIESMYAAGARIFVEIGPGNVLSGLVSDCLAGQAFTAIALDSKRTNGTAQFLAGLGALSVLGLSVDYKALFAEAPPAAPRTAPSSHAVMICGANLGRPYPPAGGAVNRAQPNPPRSEARPTSVSSSIDAPRTAAAMTLPTPSPETALQPAPRAPAPSAAERIWQEVSQRHQDYLAAVSAAHSQFLATAGALLAGSASAFAPALAQLPQPVPAASSGRAAASPSAGVATATELPETRAKAQANGHASHETHGRMNGSDRATNVASCPPESPLPQPKVEPAITIPGAPLAPAAGSSGDAIGIVRAVISEKTGYPPEMLEADMDLEGELGVDSIKQVEILSALRERLPDLPEIEPERLPEMRTIAAIGAMIARTKTADPISQPVSAAPSPPVSRTVVQQAPAGSGVIVTAEMVRALIAEKTGYPTDMLEDDMDLEGELGVDSIKQVEILSALRERVPSLPEVDPEHMAELRTIRKIADFFA